MNLRSDFFRDAWHRLTGRLRSQPTNRKYTSDEPPLRAELFSADQMEQHGKVLAGVHRVSVGRAPDHLLARLSENETALLHCCKAITGAVKANRRISPAGEWLLDNFYLIEEQIRTAKRHLPKGYSRELPRLARGPSAGLPRAYDIALEAISHGDGWVDPGSLARFVAAYQKVTPLKLGELWAIPIMPTYENTLLDRTYQATVDRQIVYGLQRGVAWGISECGYNTVDTALNYQYRAFGVPGLGLKRGLAEDLVIAPYASALALMVAPEKACANLQRLAAEGITGKYGFYEAVDYTVSRLPRGQSSAVIRSFMAHHQGMIFLSLAYALLDRPMQKRFGADPMIRATTLLLQERVPKIGSFQLHTAEFAAARAAPDDGGMPFAPAG